MCATVRPPEWHVWEGSKTERNSGFFSGKPRTVADVCGEKSPVVHGSKWRFWGEGRPTIGLRAQFVFGTVVPVRFSTSIFFFKLEHRPEGDGRRRLRFFERDPERTLPAKHALLREMTNKHVFFFFFFGRTIAEKHAKYVTGIIGQQPKL